MYQQPCLRKEIIHSNKRKSDGGHARVHNNGTSNLSDDFKYAIVKLIKDLLVSKDKELSSYKSSSTNSSFE